MALVGLIGDSPGLATVRTQVEQLLRRQSKARRLPPVLILGETGTGKGLLAKAIHEAGPRAAGPFIGVNCAAIPETLLEAELFGFERGAFTDAHQAKPGLFQTAHRGTLFLDEIGLLPEALQSKLLTAIEEQAVRRLGSTRSESVDVWIISATSADLAAARRARPDPGSPGRDRLEHLTHRRAARNLAEHLALPYGEVRPASRGDGSARAGRARGHADRARAAGGAGDAGAGDPVGAAAPHAS